MTITYEQLLAMIRHHMTDPLIGKGKFGREERLADALLAVIKTDFEGKNVRMPGQINPFNLHPSMPSTLLTTPVGAEARVLGSSGSNGSVPDDQIPASQPPAPLGLSLVEKISSGLPDWLARQDRF